MSENKVKVKMLKNAGNYMAGDEVLVTAEEAAVMCTVRKRQTGHGLEDYRVAMTVEEVEKLKALPIDLGGLTVDEARAMGIKNIVAVPKEDLERPFHPGFVEVKDPMEGASALQAQKMNANNPNGKKRAS